MNKFLAVVKREYVQRVRSKMFIVTTLLGPLMLVLFTVVPTMLVSIKTGGPVRVAVVDEGGRLYGRVREAILTDTRADDDDDEGESAGEKAVSGAVNQNTSDRLKKTGESVQQSYAVEEASMNGRSLEEVKASLNERVKHGELDAYLVLPGGILENGAAEFYARNVGDMTTKRQIQDRLTKAVREQRMVERNIQPVEMRDINRPLKLKSLKVGEQGTEEDSGQGFITVFILGFIIYLSILMYGQVILGAIIEEKETRIAEILFSSIRPFPLMLGKLIGVSLVALTQFAIWGLAFAAFGIYGVAMMAASGMPLSLHIQPMLYVYFPLFFLLGYFLYSTIYALVGSMVTTAQEGGQLAFPIIMILVFSLYLAFPVIRSPNSPFAFWISMVPFFAPITMLVRIVTQTPPFWQIALSLSIGFGTVILLLWTAGRIYRVGMLMYGKKASLPEAWRWIKQS